MPAPVFRNSVIVGALLPAEMDGGGNELCPTRAACGFAPYPSLEPRR
jgi:hypothetical protein